MNHSRSTEETARQFLDVLSQARGPQILRWGPLDLVRAVHCAELVDAQLHHPDSSGESAIRTVCQSLWGQSAPPSQFSAKRQCLEELLNNPHLYSHPLIVPLFEYIVAQCADSEKDLSSQKHRGSIAISAWDVSLFANRSVLSHRMAASHSTESHLREQWHTCPDEFPSLCAAALLLNKQLCESLHDSPEKSNSLTAPLVSHDTTAIVEKEKLYLEKHVSSVNIIAIQILGPAAVVRQLSEFRDNDNEQLSQHIRQQWRTIVREHDTGTHATKCCRQSVEELLLPLVVSNRKDCLLAMHPVLLGMLARAHFSVARQYLNLLVTKLKALMQPQDPDQDEQPSHRMIGQTFKRIAHLSSFSANLRMTCAQVVRKICRTRGMSRTMSAFSDHFKAAEYMTQAHHLT